MPVEKYNEIDRRKARFKTIYRQLTPAQRKSITDYPKTKETVHIIMKGRAKDYEPTFMAPPSEERNAKDATEKPLEETLQDGTNFSILFDDVLVSYRDYLDLSAANTEYIRLPPNGVPAEKYNMLDRKTKRFNSIYKRLTPAQRKMITNYRNRGEPVHIIIKSKAKKIAEAIQKQAEAVPLLQPHITSSHAPRSPPRPNETKHERKIRHNRESIHRKNPNHKFRKPRSPVRPGESLYERKRRKRLEKRETFGYRPPTRFNSALGRLVRPNIAEWDRLSVQYRDSMQRHYRTKEAWRLLKTNPLLYGTKCKYCNDMIPLVCRRSHYGMHMHNAIRFGLPPMTEDIRNAIQERTKDSIPGWELARFNVLTATRLSRIVSLSTASRPGLASSFARVSGSYGGTLWMMRGIDKEEPALSQIQEALDISDENCHYPVGLIHCIHPSLNFLACTPDALYRIRGLNGEPDRLGMIEIKNPICSCQRYIERRILIPAVGSTSGEFLGAIPPLVNDTYMVNPNNAFFIQCVTQLICTGRDFVDLVILFDQDDKNFPYCPQIRDDAAWKAWRDAVPTSSYMWRQRITYAEALRAWNSNIQFKVVEFFFTYMTPRSLNKFWKFDHRHNFNAEMSTPYEPITYMRSRPDPNVSALLERLRPNQFNSVLHSQQNSNPSIARLDTPQSDVILQVHEFKPKMEDCDNGHLQPTSTSITSSTRITIPPPLLAPPIKAGSLQHTATKETNATVAIQPSMLPTIPAPPPLRGPYVHFPRRVLQSTGLPIPPPPMTGPHFPRRCLKQASSPPSPTTRSSIPPTPPPDVPLYPISGVTYPTNGIASETTFPTGTFTPVVLPRSQLLDQGTSRVVLQRTFPSQASSGTTSDKENEEDFNFSDDVMLIPADEEQPVTKIDPKPATSFLSGLKNTVHRTRGKLSRFLQSFEESAARRAQAQAVKIGNENRQAWERQAKEAQRIRSGNIQLSNWEQNEQERRERKDIEAKENQKWYTSTSSQTSFTQRNPSVHDSTRIPTYTSSHSAEPLRQTYSETQAKPTPNNRSTQPAPASQTQGSASSDTRKELPQDEDSSKDKQLEYAYNTPTPR